jgi:hypothetical protein
MENRTLIVKLINNIQAFCGIVLLGAASAVSAIPITGEIGMGGNFIAVDSNWDATSIDLATGIDFDPNLFIVNSATGSFSGVSAIGTIQDFQFGAGTGSELGVNDGSDGITAVSSITDFWAIDSFSFELTSVVKLSTSSDTFLDLDGTGIITGAGYEATIGTWSFTGDNIGGTFTWSAGSTQAVPEPGILALMGIGLVGFAVRRRA